MTQLTLRRRTLFLVFLVLLAAIPRLYGLSRQSLWFDEAYSVSKASDLKAVWFDQLDPTPPGYFTLLHFWMDAAGRSEYSLRFLSAVFGILLVVLIYSCGMSLLGEKTAIFASVICAVSPYHIYYSQEVRPYALFALLTLAALYSLYRAMKGYRPAWAAFAAFTVASAYTHNYGFFAFVAGLAYIFAVGVKKELRRPTALSLAFIVLALLHRCLLLWFNRGEDLNAWIPLPGWKDLLLTFQYFTARSWRLPQGPALSLASLAFLPVFILLVVMAAAEKRKENLLLTLYFAVPLALAFLASFKSPMYVAGRYDIVAFPAFCLLAGRGLALLRRSWLRDALFALIILIASCNLFIYYTYPGKSNDRMVAGYVAGGTGENDVVICTDLSRLSMEYYWKGRQSVRLIEFPMGRKFALPKETIACLRPQVDDQVRALVERVSPLVTGTNRLWLLYQPIKSSDILLEALEKEFELQGSVDIERGSNMNQVSRIYIFGKRDSKE